MKVTRIGPGRYEVHTNHGTYSVDNCPAENPRETGFPAGPRWMITHPGEMTADGERATKREALAYIRVLHDEHEARLSAKSDREQAEREEPQETGPSLDDYAEASRIIQSLIPGVRR
ncbi:hypothetical protein [Streptomyces sp. NRRL S-378]|uniref:hypothetical protein n=1 Tax=Streptomyces sp. NRRL S-378 TaxID=1463904 RepID=UPI0004C5946B|nr:hypothetical protein [Streptomyces sp. NRRL S-378]